MVNTLTISSDTFANNSLGSQWTKLLSGGDSVTESTTLNASPAGTGGTGIVSVSTYNFTTSDIQVDYNINTCQKMDGILAIGLTKVTSGNPYGEADWYRLYIDNGGDIYIQRNVNGGGPTILYNVGGGIPISGTIRVVISGGNITFYVNGVSTYTEAYGLSSYTAYLYMYTAGASGTAQWSNFTNNGIINTFYDKIIKFTPRYTSYFN